MRINSKCTFNDTVYTKLYCSLVNFINGCKILGGCGLPGLATFLPAAATPDGVDWPPSCMLLPPLTVWIGHLLACCCHPWRCGLATLPAAANPDGVDWPSSYLQLPPLKPRSHRRVCWPITTTIVGAPVENSTLSSDVDPGIRFFYPFSHLQLRSQKVWYDHIL